MNALHDAMVAKRIVVENFIVITANGNTMYDELWAVGCGMWAVGCGLQIQSFLVVYSSCILYCSIYFFGR